MSTFLAAWAFVSSPIGRWIAAVSLAIVVGFSWGWSIKARLDRTATLQAVITKQRIDLRASQDQADRSNAVIVKISQRDEKNLDIIRDLNEKLSTRPAADRCTLDPVSAGSLRRLR